MCGELLQPPTRTRFLDHLSAAPCLFQSLQPCSQLVVGRKRCTCVCGVWNPNSAPISQCGDEPDCGLRREAGETTNSLDNPETPLKSSPEGDPFKKNPLKYNVTNTFRSRPRHNAASVNCCETENCQQLNARHLASRQSKE